MEDMDTWDEVSSFDPRLNTQHTHSFEHDTNNIYDWNHFDGLTQNTSRKLTV